MVEMHEAAMTLGVQETMHILQGNYDLPGPFTILHGIAGDGMANTIDTMPQLVIDNHNEDGPGATIENVIDTEATRRSDTLGISEIASTGSVPHEILEDHSTSNENCDILSNETGENSDNVDGDLFSIIGSSSETSSIELVMHSQANAITSSPSAGDSNAIANDNRATLNQGSRLSPAESETVPVIGLHLPLPSGVATMNYNSMLPPVGTGLLPRHPPKANAESFIMIDASRNATSSGQSHAIEIDHESTVSSPPDTGISPRTDHRYIQLSASNNRSISDWESTCRQNEMDQLNEILVNSQPTTAASSLYRNQWWKGENNYLRLFEEQPTYNVSPNAKTVSHDTNDITPSVKYGRIIGELSPGTTVMAVEKITIAPPEINGRRQQSPNQGVIEILKIESPKVGYVVCSISGYTLVGPGLPCSYTEPDMWLWKVTCTSGAYVRQGLELSSVHVDTIPYGSFVQVKRKTINAMGLSRLQVEAYVQKKSGSHNSTSRERGHKGIRFSDALQSISMRNRSDSNDIKPQLETTKVIGWISEVLNPLSGQTGPVVQSIPCPVPAQFRVTLPVGAVIRQGLELSSNQIGHAPFGSILNIVGRAYSQHSMDRCIQRLKLAGGGGWVSAKLNRQTSGDQLSVLEEFDTDGSFDPDDAGLYHIEKQLQVMDEYHMNISEPNETDQQNMNNVTQSLARLTSSLSSIVDEDETLTSSVEEVSNNDSSLTSSAVPALYRNGVATSTSSQAPLQCGSKRQKDEPCLICLSEERNATIVHGETGHIACCLTCARLLKGRGDKCPVCRLPIDLIIQQFWA